MITLFKSCEIMIMIVMKTATSFNILAVERIEEICKRTSAIAKEPLEISYLFQRISMVIQRECSFILEHVSDRLEAYFNHTIFPLPYNFQVLIIIIIIIIIY